MELNPTPLWSHKIIVPGLGVAANPRGQQALVTDEMGAWLIEQGYATPVEEIVKEEKQPSPRKRRSKETNEDEVENVPEID